MNNYQIYEEIGRGRNSIVYKGRRKRSIEYYAIASIDKSQRQRVLNSVHFLRSMNHETILRFTNWYETTNHLWVISEYCIGGSLKNLLELEHGLPERCTRTLGFDIVRGLSHVHSRGVIYTDIKPSNILMDDCAMLRLYDFGLAQSVETAVKGVRVGTPAYMAPELFAEGGVHSYTSDLWALGCVLYEMATGRPPFVDSELQGLMQRIVMDSVPRVEHYSTCFNDLIEGLLQKDPLQRATWEDVYSSEFWNSVNTEQLGPPELPPQPAFDKFKKMRQEAAKSDDVSKHSFMEKASKDALRASINAQRNLARELSDRGGYATTTQQALGVDRELDFTDPAEAELERDADRADSASSAGNGSFDPSALSKADAPTTSLPPEVVNPAVPLPQSSKQPALDGPRMSVRASLRMASSGTKLPDTPDPGSVENLLSHPSDNTVRPIMMNTRIERITDPRYEAGELPFPMRTVAQLKALDPKEVEFFLQGVYQALSGPSGAQDKTNTLSYFATLCSDPTMANVFINSSVAALCVRLLTLQSTPTHLCVLIATTLGLLLRFANVILPEVQKTGILPALAQASARSQPVKVRRRALAGLGELLFYIASSGGGTANQWQVPNEARQTIMEALDDEDEITRHYAVKIIENIVVVSTTGDTKGPLFELFDAAPVMGALLSVFVAPPNQVKSEHLRASALNTALRLATYDDSLVPILTGALSPATFFADILAANSPRAVQALLTFLNATLARLVGAILADRSRSEQHLVSAVQWAAAAVPQSTRIPFFVPTPPFLGQQRQLVGDCMSQPEGMLNGLSAALEHSNPAIRGKATLAALMLTVVTGPFLGQACEAGLMLHIDRLAHDKETYVRQCAVFWRRLLERFVIGTMHELSRVDTLQAAAALSKELKLVLHVVTPPTLRSFTLADGEVYVAAGSGLAALASLPNTAPESEDYRRVFFLLLEAIGQDVQAMTAHHVKVVTRVLTPLVQLLLRMESTDGVTRFSAVKLLHDWLAVLVNKHNVYNAAYPQAGSFASINAVAESIVPQLPSLLADNDPIPLYTLKIINLVGDRNTVFMGKVASPGIVTTLLQFIRLGGANATVFSLKALLRVLQCGEDALMVQAANEGLAERVSEMARAALREGSMEGFFDTCLEICLFALCAAQRGGSPTLINACAQCSNDIEGIFLPPCAAKISSGECAASCLSIIVSLFPACHMQLCAPGARKLITQAAEALDEPTSHIVQPLVDALSAAVKATPRMAAELLGDEVWYVTLEEAAEQALRVNPDCATAIRRLLAEVHTAKNTQIIDNPTR